MGLQKTGETTEKKEKPQTDAIDLWITTKTIANTAIAHEINLAYDTGDAGHHSQITYDMKNAIIKSSDKSLGKLTPEKIELIKRTVAKGATDDELSLFVAVANRTGLDPFTHQIHFVKRRIWNKNAKKYDEIGSIQTGVDGYRAIAARTGEHAGTDDAVIEEKDGLPVKASVTVYRMIGGERCPFTATARFSEYAQKYEKNGTETLMGQWGRMPFLMLSKVAECLALRKGFPNDLSGVYSDEEMQQADVPAPKAKAVKVVETTAEVVQEKPTVNSAKNRIALLMKSAGLQPTVETPEAWTEAVKKATGLECVEENYEEILKVLETTNAQPE